MKIIQNAIKRIKAFFQKYANNDSHTLSADIKEFFATYALSVGYYILYILPQRDELKRTKELKNTKKEKNCFVFANGPSMNLLDVKKIEGYQKAGFDVICVNSYIISDMANSVVPNYYVLSDPVSFDASNNEVSDDVMDAQNRQIDRLNELNIPVFIPAQFSNLVLLKQHYIFNDFNNRFTRNINPMKPNGYSTMTAYKALALACYLGYDTIFICGFDNDYFKTVCVDENNNKYYLNKHYYDGGDMCKIGPEWGDNIPQLFWKYYLLFKTLYLFEKYDIVNLNKKGIVDAFTKKHDLDIYK